MYFYYFQFRFNLKHVKPKISHSVVHSPDVQHISLGQAEARILKLIQTSMWLVSVTQIPEPSSAASQDVYEQEAVMGSEASTRP